MTAVLDQQAKLDLAREEVGLLEARERVNRLLGLWGETTSWRFAEPLPPPPDEDPNLEPPPDRSGSGWLGRTGLPDRAVREMQFGV